MLRQKKLLRLRKKKVPGISVKKVEDKLSKGGITFDQMQELIKNKDKKKSSCIKKKHK